MPASKLTARSPSPTLRSEHPSPDIPGIDPERRNGPGGGTDLDASTNAGEHDAASRSAATRTLDESRRLRAIAAGSHEALGETYDLFAPGAYRLALGALGDAVLAEQVVEEAFLTLWRRASSRTFEDTPVAVWLVRFVRERVRALGAAPHAPGPVGAGQVDVRASSATDRG